MTDLIYYIVCGVLSGLVMFGIALMSKVKTSVAGNALSALATLAAIVVTLIKFEIIGQTTALIIIGAFALVGTVVGIVLAVKVKMIQMPELVALLNGVGGAASALVGIIAYFSSKTVFDICVSSIAVLVGLTTLIGSLVAAGKLAKIISGKPVVWKAHSLITNGSLIISVALVVLSVVFPSSLALIILLCAASCFFGYAFAIRVGGADMPITISLLNSLSGVAGAIAGMAIGDILLVSIGGIVGASGLLLTQIMCRAMNRSLVSILFGGAKKQSPSITTKTSGSDQQTKTAITNASPVDILKTAKKVIIVPGYGMALAQAQHLVKQLAGKLGKNGAEVKFAVHPVAGRMPGHMNVLLAEADVSYDELYEMDNINGEFASADAVVVVGANDVLNPAANTAEDTPIYGMPILNVGDCKNIIFCNYDTKPGYAGVNNPLYERSEGVHLLLGNAAETLQKLLNEMSSTASEKSPASENLPAKILKTAKKVIIVPGYGMALAQAQHLVKQLADKLGKNGAEVKFAIHPVAGRMPGHMNVLLAEADVSYDELYEMDDINGQFKTADVTVVVGANDVLNPAANTAEGTPIYGMPILNAYECKNIVFCNYDTKPGYAGVNNPLYERGEGVYLLMGNAAETLQGLLDSIS